MKPHNIVQILSSFAVAVNALQILPKSPASNFPECGINCAVFQQAQGACGSQTPNLAAENCFCQFSAVQPFYASADNVCPSECTSAGDRATLKNWFTGFCGQVGSGTDPLADSSTQTTAAPTSTATFQPGPPTKDQETGSAWFKDHWQWIVMLVILIVGLTAVGFLFRWMRNRHQRKLAEQSKRNSKRASKRLSELIMSPLEKSKPAPAANSDGLWGPHQHMAASQGFQYDMEHGHYPPGGARADPWRDEAKSTSKYDTSPNVQVTEVGATRGDSDYHSAEVGRARMEDRHYGNDRNRHAR